MLPSRRPFLADEELGKKDDDHRPRTDRGQLWSSKKKQWKLPRPRRFLMGIVALYLLYLFFKNMPTDLAPATERFNPGLAEARQKAAMSWSQSTSSSSLPQQGPPPRDDFATENKDSFYYEGRIRFFDLAKTLHRFQKPPGARVLPASHAVVFAGANLRSVSDMLPLACRMADQKINEVHFVLIGRDDVSIEGIQRVNGINDGDCPINWHDGRPDYAQWSTEARMQAAVEAVLTYVQSYLRPQVVITQGESLEDHFFSKGAEGILRRHGIPNIVLPSAAMDLMWMSVLDTNALRVWNDLDIGILIHAPSESSGSLIRLIRSLEDANYLGSTPSLTIELPPRVDPALLRFLKSMKWPPHTSSKVTLRRRIQPHNMNSAEASLKTVEAFYPRDPNVSHVLVLSPQAELSASFYHYLKYTILKYKYSVSTAHAKSNLFGISLELPATLPTNGDVFSPPKTNTLLEDHFGEILPTFLWQAPNSNAALYFGDKWAELHSFLSSRLAIQETAPETSSHKKLLSKKYPAVMEYLLELIRAKGYYLLYPAFPASGTEALATVHNELYHPPEEFISDKSPQKITPEMIDDPSTPLTADSIGGLGSVEKPLSRASTIMPLLDQFSVKLPTIDTLPILSYNGEQLSEVALARDTNEYMQQFRVHYGGCPDSRTVDTSSSALFCTDD